jgi:hypothetical protein
MILAIPHVASASCNTHRVPWAFDQTISSTWHTTSGSVCLTVNNHPDNIDAVEIDSKPNHGTAGKSGRFGVAYRPNPGFKGSDSFSYAVTSNGNYRRGSGLVAHVMVNVISE